MKQSTFSLQNMSRLIQRFWAIFQSMPWLYEGTSLRILLSTSWKFSKYEQFDFEPYFSQCHDYMKVPVCEYYFRLLESSQNMSRLILSHILATVTIYMKIWILNFWREESADTVFDFFAVLEVSQNMSRLIQRFWAIFQPVLRVKLCLKFWTRRIRGYCLLTSSKLELIYLYFPPSFHQTVVSVL